MDYNDCGMAIISNQLRQYIRNCGMTVSAIAEGAGIPQPMLSRFLNGAGAYLSTVDKLTEYLGLELCKSLKADEPAAAAEATRAEKPAAKAARKSGRKPNRKPKP
jgi:DNA transposition AAA+ family ATPase